MREGVRPLGLTQQGQGPAGPLSPTDISVIRQEGHLTRIQQPSNGDEEIVLEFIEIQQAACTLPVQSSPLFQPPAITYWGARGLDWCLGSATD